MNILHRLRTSFLFTISFIAVSVLPGIATPVQAQGKAWSGVCVNNGVATIQGFQCLLGNVLSVAVSGIGLIGFVMLIIGSFRYLLSGGNAKGVEGGRNTMTFAIVGLVVALASFMILQLVANFTGVKSILNFRIPGSDTQFSP
jgi:hypothetical protein